MKILIAIAASAVAVFSASSLAAQAPAPKPAGAVTTTKTSSKAKKPEAKAKSPTPVSIPLPTAHSGQPYTVFVPLPPVKFYGPPIFKLEAAPAWLRYETSTSTFRGTPDDNSTATYVNIKLTVSPQPQLGTASDAQTYLFSLPVVVGAESVYFPSGPKAPAVPEKLAAGEGTVLVQDTNANPSEIPTPRAVLSTPVNSATIEIDGRIDPRTLPTPQTTPSSSPGASPPNFAQLELEITDNLTNTTSIVSFPASGSSPQPPSKTVPIKPDGSFSMPIPSTLSNGVRFRVIAIPPSGYAFGPAIFPRHEVDESGNRVALPFQEVTEALIPTPRVTLTETLSAGQTKITGTTAPETLPPSPTQATPPDPKSGSTGSPGNLPSLAVEIQDPNTKLVTRIPLLISGPPGSSTSQIQIGTDGVFSLPLQTALASGEKVRIIAVPPQGYAFRDLPARDRCDFSPPIGLKKVPTLVEPSECVVLPTPEQPNLSVYSTLILNAPVVTSKLALNATTISGTATPSTTGSTGTTILVGVERYALGDPCRAPTPSRIVTSDEMVPHEKCGDINGKPPQFADLSVAASGSTPATTAKSVQTQSNGTFSLTLAEPLSEEERVRIVQILPPGTSFPDKSDALNLAYSQLITVPSVADWGRVRADFAAGLLMTNNNQLNAADTGNFTQVHEFLDMNIEKYWTLPGCYLQFVGQCVRQYFELNPVTERIESTYETNPEKWWSRHHPGVSSYFEGRLTAIPVASAASSTASTSGSSNPTGSGSSSSSSSGSSSSSASSLLSSNLLTTAQTARFGAGIYLPAIMQRWYWHAQPNALFIAPLAKVGFDSVTSPTTINVPAGTPGASSSGTITLEPLFNSWGFGGRLGHYLLSRSENKAPETESHVDVAFGPYSNLQSYICHQTPTDKVMVTTTTTASGAPTTTTSYLYVSANGYSTTTGYPGSSCAEDYPAYYAAAVPKGLTFTIPPNTTSGTTTTTYQDLMTYTYQPVDSRKRLYRLDIEGLFKVPATPLYLGFNANLGQKTFGAIRLDHGYIAPDDLEIFFGTKFDIGELFAKIGVAPF